MCVWEMVIQLPARGKGNIHLTMVFKMSMLKKVVIYNSQYAPNLTSNLFCVRAVASKGNTVKLELQSP